MLQVMMVGDIIKKQWFLSQVGKAIDCNSMIAGSSPTGTSKKYFKKNKKSIEILFAFCYYI